MRITEDYPILKSCIILKESDDKNICKYLSEKDICEQSFGAGEEILSRDSRDVPVTFLLEGIAQIYSADASRHVLLRTAGAGAVFGVATLYSLDAPFPTKIRAKNNCKVLFVSPEAMRSLIENDFAANKAFLTFLCNRIVYLNKKINAFTAGSAERKLTLFLADNETDGVYHSDMSLSALAEMLDIGRASLYRAFDALIADGLIEKHEKRIIIKDKNAMLEKYFG